MKSKFKSSISSLILILTICCTILTGTSFTAKASPVTGNPMSMIINAAQSMKTAQMKMNKIVNDMNMSKQYTTVTNTTTAKPNLTLFGIHSYIEHGAMHKDYNETVHRSNLPLSILTYQEGYGEITGVSIDGTPLQSALLSKIKIDDNHTIDEVCAQLIVFDESLINSLSNGKHSITIKCTGKNGTRTDDASFILAD